MFCLDADGAISGCGRAVTMGYGGASAMWGEEDTDAAESTSTLAPGDEAWVSYLAHAMFAMFVTHV